LLVGTFAGGALVLGGAGQGRIAAAFLLSGVLSSGILAIGQVRSGWRPSPQVGRSIPGGVGFRLAVILLVGAATWGLTAPGSSSGIPVPPARLTAAALVFALGLLQLGLSQELGAVSLGLLTALSGFEMFYTGLEPSLALRAVLAAVMLGIAVVTSVILGSPPEAGADERRSA